MISSLIDDDDEINVVVDGCGFLFRWERVVV